MFAFLSRNWWALALRGLVAVLFGLFALFLPEVTLGALVLLFGAYALVDGLFSVIGAFNRDIVAPWWALLLEGLLGITAGVLTFIWPQITAVVLLYLIVAWAILTGFMEIILAIMLRREMEGEWLLALSGLLSIALGIVMAIFPAAGAVALSWVIGIYALVFGVTLIALGFRLRQWRASIRRSISRESHQAA